MARENTVYLYGRVINKPGIQANPETYKVVSGQIALTTLRRSYATKDLMLRGQLRLDVPCVFSRSEGLIKQMSELTVGNMIIVKGSLCTQEVPKKHICPYCGHEHIKENGVIVYIDPIHIMNTKVVADEKEGFELLKDNDEISNQIYVYGTLCREPSFYINEETHKKECQFQIATNRKRRIEGDGPDKRTDYPWVKVFGPLAEECSTILHMGSSIYINGAIETRSITQKFTCEECGEEFERPSYSTEIVPYSIEYLENCDIPKPDVEEEEDEDNEESED